MPRDYGRRFSVAGRAYLSVANHYMLTNTARPILAGILRFLAFSHFRIARIPHWLSMNPAQQGAESSGWR
jgi:hypothetical protein